MVTIVILVKALSKLMLCAKVARTYTDARGRALQNNAMICLQRVNVSVCQDEGVAAEMGFGFDRYVAFRAQSGTGYIWSGCLGISDCYH